MMCRLRSVLRHVPRLLHLQTYYRLSNRYVTLGYTTKIIIEVICTTVYTLNGHTVLTLNTLHIPALCGLIYSLRKYRQIPGCGVYSSYKDGLYLFLPNFILQVEDSYYNIVSYRPLVTSHQVPIDYMEPISTRSTTMATPSGLPSMIYPAEIPQTPHNIPSYENSLSFQHPLPPYKYINCLPQPPTKVPPTETRNANLHKNSLETLSVRTLNLVHKDATNLPTIPPSSTSAPCDNCTQFKSLNIHLIFGCR